MQDRSENTTGLPDDVWDAVTDQSRLSALGAMKNAHDTPGDPDFDRVTALAASVFNAPVALITLIDAERQWFRSCIGVDISGTPVGMSFCAHAIATSDEVTVVTDASADPRFVANALVTGSEHVRFYAGAPIIISGEKVGTLCVLDRIVRPYPEAGQIEQLKLLAGLVSSLFVLKEDRRSGAIARQALDREEKRRAVALAAASLASWVWDVKANRIECDDMLPPLYGLPSASSMKPRNIFHAIDNRDVSGAETRFREALKGREDYFGEYRIKGFDPPRWLASRGRVVERDEEDRPVLVFGVTYDISERKAADERQKLLLRELNHRVKNTLATVQALASQTVRHASDPSKFLEAFSARLQALGQAHGLLSDNEWRGIALKELVRLEVMPFDATAPSRIKTSGPDISLTPDQAVGLGLVLHELASNAMKFGALSTASGTVDVLWKVERETEKRTLVLTWTELGGPNVQPPARNGFGSILIRRSLDKVISSAVTHEFRPEGVYAQVRLPIDAGS